MTKFNALVQTEATQTAVDALCEAQDAVLMQIFAMARLARAALDSDADDAELDVGHALDAIIRIAAAASAQLDAAQIAVSDARLANAARAGAASPFGRVEPL